MWFYGWFLVGISPNKEYSGYAADFAHQGCDVRLFLSDGGPLKHRFWFQPKSLKRVYTEGS